MLKKKRIRNLVFASAASILYDVCNKTSKQFWGRLIRIFWIFFIANQGTTSRKALHTMSMQLFAHLQ